MKSKRKTRTLKLRIISNRGTWEVQWVKRLTLDFGSGHDLTVCEIKPHVWLCADSMEPAWDSLCPFLSAPPSLTHTLFLKVK